ncbi:MAG: O-methyltransferase [Pyrinomonadaceae bacterium]
MSWRKIPFLRWSFWRLLFGMKHLTTEWQVGDGREAKLHEYVLKNAQAGDAADVIKTIDEFAYNQSFLINVGEQKGQILDNAVRQVGAKKILELGTYCGYSSLRMAAAAPEARIFSLEFNADNAEIARSIHNHAGVDDRVTVILGTLGDGGKTVDALDNEYGFSAGSVDLVFLDHAKEAYLPDIKMIVEKGWLRTGAIAVGDNIKFPGAPEYRAYMKENEGKLWKTEEHETHAEYQTVIKDLVLVSEYLGS